MLTMEILLNGNLVATLKTPHDDIARSTDSIGAELDVFHDRPGGHRFHSWLHIHEANALPVSHILRPDDVVLIRILEA